MKIKRLLALTLALMMVVALFAMPAAAMYFVPSTCPACGSGGNIGLWEDEGWAVYSMTSCSHGYSGRDELQKNTGKLRCYDDNTIFYGAKYRTYCPLGGKYY